MVCGQGTLSSKYKINIHKSFGTACQKVITIQRNTKFGKRLDIVKRQQLNNVTSDEIQDNRFVFLTKTTILPK